MVGAHQGQPAAVLLAVAVERVGHDGEGNPAPRRSRLEALDHSRGPEGMNLPGFRLHALKGRLKGHYAVSVSGNWRVTFRFEDGAAVDVDYGDYH